MILPYTPVPKLPIPLNVGLASSGQVSHDRKANWPPGSNTRTGLPMSPKGAALIAA